MEAQASAIRPIGLDFKLWVYFMNNSRDFLNKQVFDCLHLFVGFVSALVEMQNLIVQFVPNLVEVLFRVDVYYLTYNQRVPLLKAHVAGLCVLGYITEFLDLLVYQWSLIYLLHLKDV